MNILFFLHKIWNTFFSKDSFLGKAAIAVALYLAPVKLYAVTILMLMLIDVVTGVWASRKKGLPFKSRLLRRGLLEKTIIYGMLLIMSLVFGNLLQSVLQYETSYIAWALTILIAVYEITSIIENVIIIKPELAFLNRFKSLITSIGNKQVDNLETKVSGDLPEEKRSE